MKDKWQGRLNEVEWRFTAYLQDPPSNPYLQIARNPFPETWQFILAESIRVKISEAWHFTLAPFQELLRLKGGLVRQKGGHMGWTPDPRPEPILPDPPERECQQMPVDLLT